MDRKIIHVVGTGTIGEPLIGLLCDFQDQLGIDEITFHKNSALNSDHSKVVGLINFLEKKVLTFQKCHLRTLKILRFTIR